MCCEKYAYAYENHEFFLVHEIMRRDVISNICNSTNPTILNVRNVGYIRKNVEKESIKILKTGNIKVFLSESLPVITG